MEALETKRTIGLFAKIITGCIALLLIAEAIATSFYIPDFERIFIGFGSDLPIFTEVILASKFWIWLLPVSALSLMYFGWPKGKARLLPVTLILILGILYIPAALFGVYMPIIELGEAIEQ